MIKEQWKFETGDSIYRSPIVLDGILYFGSSDKHLYAVDAKTGKEQWCKPDYDYSSNILAVSDEVVYFGSFIFNYGDNDNYLHAVDVKTGKEQWKFKTGGSVSSTVSDGVVYFSSTDNHLYAVEAKTGKEKWRFRTGDSIHSSPVVLDGIVYVGSTDNYLYAVDVKTGKEQWKFETGGLISESPLVTDGLVCVASKGPQLHDPVSGYDNHNCLYAVDAKTGKEQWKFETKKAGPFNVGDSIYESLMVLSDGIIYVVGIGKRIGSNSHLYAVDAKTGKEQWKFEASDRLTLSPAVSDGIVYIGCKDNHLYAVDAKTGKEQWKFKTGDSISESPTVSDGIVYIFPTSPSPAHRSCKDNHLYAVDAKTGKEQWKFKTGDSINSSPTVLDGIVYIGCKDNLYAVRA